MNSKQVVLITGSSIGCSGLFADTLARKGRPRPGSAHQGVTRGAIAGQSDCNNGPFDISLRAIAGAHRSRVSSPSNGGSQCAYLNS
jgi:hypothetical protein